VNNLRFMNNRATSGAILHFKNTVYSDSTDLYFYNNTATDGILSYQYDATNTSISNYVSSSALINNNGDSAVSTYKAMFYMDSCVIVGTGQGGGIGVLMTDSAQSIIKKTLITGTYLVHISVY
jgi:hypothetical protein